MRLTDQRQRAKKIPTDKTRKKLLTTDRKKKINRLPTWTAIIDICFQKEEIRRAFCIFSSLRSNHIKGSCRISCRLLTFWPEECGIILQNNFPYSSPRNLQLQYFNHVVCPAMSGIIKVIVSFFRKGEEVAIERHRRQVPVDKDKDTRVFELKKHLTNLSSYKFYTLYGAQSLKTR